MPRNHDPMVKFGADFVAAVDKFADGIVDVVGHSHALRFVSKNGFPIDSVYMDILHPMISVQFPEESIQDAKIHMERDGNGVVLVVVSTTKSFPSETDGELHLGDLRVISFRTPKVFVEDEW